MELELIFCGPCLSLLFSLENLPVACESLSTIFSFSSHLQLSSRAHPLHRCCYTFPWVSCFSRSEGKAAKESLRNKNRTGFPLFSMTNALCGSSKVLKLRHFHPHLQSSYISVFPFEISQAEWGRRGCCLNGIVKDPYIYGGILKCLQWYQRSSPLAQKASCMTTCSEYAIRALDCEDPLKARNLERLVNDGFLAGETVHVSYTRKVP